VLLRRLILPLVLMCCIQMSALFGGVESPWLVFYHQALGKAAFQQYDLLVLDSSYNLPFNFAVDDDITVLGYISLGEVEDYRPHFSEVKEEGILFHENENWKGSYYVDVRDPKWARRVIEELIPQILHRGFDGLFIDTLDNPAHLERTDPKKYRGMTESAVNLVKAIRHHFPRVKLMLNRGYDILDKVAPHIDMMLGESVLADYNFETKTYDWVPKPLYQQQVDILHQAQKKFPHLEVFTLDYWNPDDPEGIAQIYQKQRENGFRPYVATIALDRIIPEPK